MLRKGKKGSQKEATHQSKGEGEEVTEQIACCLLPATQAPNWLVLGAQGGKKMGFKLL